MFSLRIHSIEKRPSVEGEGSSPSNRRSQHSFEDPEIHETRGIIHLYRDVSLNPHQPPLPVYTTSIPPPSFVYARRSTLLFVIAIPSRMSTQDFLHFCGFHVNNIVKIHVIRNDGMDDRYSMLIRLADQKSADDFYLSLSGRRFPSTEAEVCHILFTATVEYTESAEIAATPPNGYTELPTCPVCIERLDQDTSGILTTLCDHSFQCSCISKWTDSSCPVCRFCQQQDEKPTCSVCETSENLWICVICGFIGCGRYKEGHAVRHWRDTQHCYSLDLETQRVWDYVGDSYVHRLNQSKADGKLVDLNSHCTSTVDDCGACECSGDSGISGALFSSKVDAIVDEYNHLLASQLENQRQYYESLLAEAKGKREKSISEVVEKAVDSKMHSLQLELEKCMEEKAFVSNINENLMKNQDLWRKQIKEIEERERAALRLRDEKIIDLEEQIRDLIVYIEAQKTLNNMADADDIRSGTLLPVPLHQSSPANAKKPSKGNRRRG